MTRRVILHLLILAAVLLLIPVASVSAHGEPDEWVEQQIEEAAEEFEQSVAELRAVLHCESAHWDPAVIYGPRRGLAGEEGIAQFLGGAQHPFWQDSPWSEYSPDDPAAAIRVMAWHWERDPETKWQWSCWRSGA